MNAYAEKNSRRRQYRAEDRDAYDRGRAARAVEARNGAFGQVRSAAKYNRLIEGTGGVPRVLG